MEPNRAKPLILVVDDEPDVRSIACRFLRRWDYESLQAENGAVALEMAEKHRPDLILLDMRMPVMTGLEVLDRIRSNSDLALTPVVILTGLNTDADHTDGVRHGADDYLTKPIDPVLLRARIESLMTRETLRWKLEEMRRDLAAMIVHDIRNPVNVIRGFAELLLEEDEIKASEFAPGAIQRILENSDRVLNLVSQMLDLSQLQAGRVKLARERIDLGEFLVRLGDEQRLLATHKRIELLVDVEESLTVEADALKLSEVVVNLVSNAIKFTPEAGKIRVSASRRPDGKLLVSVTDSGPGIPKAQQQRLFAPWERIEGRVMSVKGYGLGLAIARMIVEAHGGELGVDSEPGNGATFRFTIPEAGPGEG